MMLHYRGPGGGSGTTFIMTWSVCVCVFMYGQATESRWVLLSLYIKTYFQTYYYCTIDAHQIKLKYNDKQKIDMKGDFQ